MLVVNVSADLVSDRKNSQISCVYEFSVFRNEKNNDTLTLTRGIQYFVPLNIKRVSLWLCNIASYGVSQQANFQNNVTSKVTFCVQSSTSTRYRGIQYFWTEQFGPVSRRGSVVIQHPERPGEGPSCCRTWWAQCRTAERQSSGCGRGGGGKADSRSHRSNNGFEHGCRMLLRR